VKDRHDIDGLKPGLVNGARGTSYPSATSAIAAYPPACLSRRIAACHLIRQSSRPVA
jgi:hypothetical protein